MNHTTDFKEIGLPLSERLLPSRDRKKTSALFFSLAVGSCVAILPGCAAVGEDSSSGGLEASEDQLKAQRGRQGEQVDVKQECGEAPNGLRPTMEKLTTRGNVTLRVATQGSRNNQALVLLHGFPDSWCGWGRVIPELSKRFFVVAPDLRGYNRSSKPGTADPTDVAAYALPELLADVDAVVDFAEKATRETSERGSPSHGSHAKPALVAHDWGAIIAWQYARSKGDELPAKIDRLIAVSVPHPLSMSLMLGAPAANVLAVANRSTRKLDFGKEDGRDEDEGQDDGDNKNNGSKQRTLGEWITEQAGSNGDESAKIAFITTQQQAQGAALAYTRELIATDAYVNFSKDGYGPFFERLKTKLFRDPGRFLNRDEQAAHVRMWEYAENGSQKSFEAMAKYYRANLATPLPFQFQVKGIPLLYVAPRYDGAINYPWGTLGLESVAPDLKVKSVSSGHFVQRETPEKLVSLITDFVNHTKRPTTSDDNGDDHP